MWPTSLTPMTPYCVSLSSGLLNTIIVEVLHVRCRRLWQLRQHNKPLFESTSVLLISTD